MEVMLQELKQPSYCNAVTMIHLSFLINEALAC